MKPSSLQKYSKAANAKRKLPGLIDLCHINDPDAPKSSEENGFTKKHRCYNHYGQREIYCLPT